MENIQSTNLENEQAGRVVKKEESNVQNARVPFSKIATANSIEGISSGSGTQADQTVVKNEIVESEDQFYECFEKAKNGMCFCNGHNRGSIGSNFYDLTPSPEFMHVMDVVTNPSKMYHLLMNDPIYGSLFNEKDPMEELREPIPVKFERRPISPVAEIDDFPNVLPLEFEPMPIEYPIPTPEDFQILEKIEESEIWK